jgi:superfamily II DNA or RNA helicase
MALRPYQKEALAARRAAPAEQNRQAIVMATGLGKGHPLETEVPTPDGWRPWGNLEIGDEVFSRDGTPTEVLEIYDRGVLPTYVVTFSDSSTVTVDGDHLWTVRDSSDSRRPWVTLETRELARAQLKLSRGWRFHVPMTAPLEHKPLELSLDPYVVGALIANGSMVSDGTQLTTPDLEVAERVARAVTCNRINDTTPGACPRYSLPGLTVVTRELGLRVHSANKRIPALYLRGSLEQRTDLLHGLMDGDGGGRDRSRRSVGYFTSSEGLTRDVLELVTSLGGTGTVKRYDRGARGAEYAVRILLPSNVPAFSSSRKAGAGDSSIRNLQPKRAIVSVQRSSDVPIRCIRVAARDSLYLITRAHVVTHNTVTFAAEAAEALDTGQAERALVLTHTDELADQALRTVELFAPGKSVGLVKATANEVGADIVIGSVQTLTGPDRRRQLTGIGRVIVDECHHATASSYGAILAHYGCTVFGRSDPLDTSPLLPATGYTATLERGDGTSLGSVWHDVAFSRGISWAVRKGYLVPPVGWTVEVPGIGAAARSDEALDTALADSIAPERVVEAWLEKATNRPRWRSTVLFAPLVRSARIFAAAFRAAGVSSAVVHGGMPKQERKAVLAAYERGEIQVVCNAMVLTEGWDSPRTSCVIIARPTRSRPLFIQMAGRGLRPWLAPEAPPREEQDCILLVVGDSTPGLASFPDLSDKPIEADEGKSLIALEDEYDLSVGLEPDPEHPYAGRVDVRQFDPLVAQRSKVWGTTAKGTLFVPSGYGGYVFIAPDAPGFAVAYVNRAGGQRVVRRIPDLELAMGLAEDEAQDRGGNLASLVADKGRAWRKGVPTDDQKALAVRLGLERELERIMAARASGKAGRLADAIDRHTASRMVDPVVEKIKARVSVAPSV